MSAAVEISCGRPNLAGLIPTSGADGVDDGCFALPLAELMDGFWDDDVPVT